VGNYVKRRGENKNSRDVNKPEIGVKLRLS